MLRPVSCLLLTLLLPTVPAALQETERVSVSTSGAQCDHNSSDPAISEDGRYVVFISQAKPLVAGDTNGFEDAFLHDRNTGVTTRVSLSLAGGQADGWTYDCDITPDGRYVTFSSSAANMVAVDTNNSYDVFRRDLATGTNTLVSVDSSGTQGDNNSSRLVISADGQVIAFDSVATNLVAGDTNGEADVFVRDLATGQTTRVSVDSSGAEGSSFSQFPTISHDGRYVAFEARSGTLVPNDDNSCDDVFLHNVPSISAGGRYVAFRSWASNLAPGDANNSLDIFVRDTWNELTSRVSVDSTGLEGDGHSYEPSISADGSYVGFDSETTNLIAADTNAKKDVFVHDVKLPPTPDIQANALNADGILDGTWSDSVLVTVQ